MLFVNPWGCKPWRGQRLGSVLANRLTYIEANCCNLSGEKGIEEKFNREGAWTMDCLGLLLGGGWAFRLTGSKGSSKGSKGLWKCRGTTKGKVDSKNKEGLVATSCGNVSAMVSFCQDADEAKWNDEKLEACVELSCLICSIWWYMQQLFLSQVAAEKASADAVALSAEAHHLKCWQTKSLQCPVYFCRMLLPLMPRTLFHVCGYVCLCVCVCVCLSVSCMPRLALKTLKMQPWRIVVSKRIGKWFWHRCLLPSLWYRRRTATNMFKCWFVELPSTACSDLCWFLKLQTPVLLN